MTVCCFLRLMLRGQLQCQTCWTHIVMLQDNVSIITSLPSSSAGVVRALWEKRLKTPCRFTMNLQVSVIWACQRMPDIPRMELSNTWETGSGRRLKVGWKSYSQQLGKKSWSRLLRKQFRFTLCHALSFRGAFVIASLLLSVSFGGGAREARGNHVG